MTRTQLYTAIAEQTGLQSAQVKIVFDAAYDVVMKRLPNEEKIALGELGFFKMVQRKARMGRNPITGDAVRIPAGRMVKFAISLPIKAAFGRKKKR